MNKLNFILHLYPEKERKHHGNVRCETGDKEEMLAQVLFLSQNFWVKGAFRKIYLNSYLVASFIYLRL